MQGLCPSLQAEFPGGGVVLSALSFPPLQKARELGFKMDEETACSVFPCRSSMIYYGGGKAFLHGESRIFTFWQVKWERHYRILSGDGAPILFVLQKIL